MTISDDPDWNTVEAMICYGGGFVAALGQLYRRADPQNQARLKGAFPEYWRSYTEIARQQQAAQAEETKRKGTL